MESLNAHCLDHQTAFMTPPSTHCDLPDGNWKHYARLTKALLLASESLRFQGSRQFGIGTCMANGPNMRGNPTGYRTQPLLLVSETLSRCARQPGFRARRQALLFAPKSTLHESRHALGEPLHISILGENYARV